MYRHTEHTAYAFDLQTLTPVLFAIAIRKPLDIVKVLVELSSPHEQFQLGKGMNLL